jgi:hypothetical protein
MAGRLEVSVCNPTHVCVLDRRATDPQGPRYLVTEPGVGYRLLVEE